MVVSEPSPTVVARAVGDELVLLDLESGACYTTNPAGALIWRLYDRGADLDTVVDALLAAYDVSEPEARAEVQTFLASAHEAGLLA